MSKIISFLLIFSFFVTSQQSLQRELQIQASDSESISHDHRHSFLTILKMTFFGIISHDHEHDHEESMPWSNTHSHDSKAHSHGDLSSLKFEIISQRSLFAFYNSEVELLPYFNSSLKSYDFQSDIFRPPITS